MKECPREGAVLMGASKGFTHFGAQYSEAGLGAQCSKRESSRYQSHSRVSSCRLGAWHTQTRLWAWTAETRASSPSSALMGRCPKRQPIVDSQGQGPRGAGALKGACWGQARVSTWRTVQKGED